MYPLKQEENHNRKMEALETTESNFYFFYYYFKATFPYS